MLAHGALPSRISVCTGRQRQGPSFHPMHDLGMYAAIWAGAVYTNLATIVIARAITVWYSRGYIEYLEHRHVRSTVSILNIDMSVHTALVAHHHKG
jgi:hypothetical protein